jgi:hypothetical protein
MSSGARREPICREDHEHLADLVFIRRVEEWDVDLRPALSLEIDRQQIGPGREQHPDDAAPVLCVAHLRGNHPKHTARRSRIALLLPAPERGVRLVHDHDNRPHRAEHCQDMFQVAFRLAHILRPEVLQDDTRDANLTAQALRHERLACPDRPTQQIAHRQAVECATLQERRVLPQPRLGRLVSDNRVEGPLGLDEFEQASALALEQPLLERPNTAASRRSPRRLQEHARRPAKCRR